MSENEHFEEREGEATPYIGFSNETLKQLPDLAIGERIRCPQCGGEHELLGPTAEDGTAPLLFYRCGEDLYLAGVDGKDVRSASTDASGWIGGTDADDDPRRLQ